MKRLSAHETRSNPVRSATSATRTFSSSVRRWARLMPNVGGASTRAILRDGRCDAGAVAATAALCYGSAHDPNQEVLMPSFAYFCGHEQFQPEVLLEHAVQAEAAGFDALAVSDHFHPWVDDASASGFA